MFDTHFLFFKSYNNKMLLVKVLVDVLCGIVDDNYTYWWQLLVSGVMVGGDGITMW